LDQAAAVLFGDFSRNRLKQWIEGGQLTIAGESVGPKARPQGGEGVVLGAGCARLSFTNRPAGLVVHPGAGNPSGTLQNALLNLDPALATVPRAGLVHRLHKDPSGFLSPPRGVCPQPTVAP